MNCNFNAAIKQYAYNELLSHPDDSVRIKSERELCTLYGISRPTVRKALAELEQEGVLIIRHGSGAFTNPAAAKYRQNPNWRRTVGILFGFGNSLVFDSYSWEVVHGAQQILEQNGMVVLPLLQLAGTDDKATEEILRLQLDAVLWLHPDAGRLEVIQRLEAEGLPVVCVGRDPGNFPGTVMYNYRECGRNLARHFLKHGQRNPLLAADGKQTVYQELVRGFEEEMEKAGNVFESRQLLLNLDSLEEDIRRLHEENTEFDGIFVFAQLIWKVEEIFDRCCQKGFFRTKHPVVVYALRYGWRESAYLDINSIRLGNLAGEYLEARIRGIPYCGTLRPVAQVIENCSKEKSTKRGE